MHALDMYVSKWVSGTQRRLVWRSQPAGSGSHHSAAGYVNELQPSLHAFLQVQQMELLVESGDQDFALPALFDADGCGTGSSAVDPFTNLHTLRVIAVRKCDGSRTWTKWSLQESFVRPLLSQLSLPNLHTLVLSHGVLCKK